MLPRSLLLLACLATLPALSAAVDCTAPTSKVDQAVCGIPSLSALDHRLAAAFDQLARTVANSSALGASEGEWDGSRDECMRAPAPEACLAGAYANRIDLLEALATDAAGKGGAGIERRQALGDYEFGYRHLTPCEPAADQKYTSCSGPGTVRIYRRGDATPFQVIPMENLVLTLTREEEREGGTVPGYKAYGADSGDFNFDGRPDFALRNGDRAAYSGPSYDIYLATAGGEFFRYHPALTELATQSLYFFEVDGGAKLLHLSSKDGCCYHSSTAYTVEDDRPVPVYRIVDDKASDPKYSLSYEERWENGQWQRVSTVEERKPEYCEEELLEAARSLGRNPETGRVACIELPDGTGAVALLAEGGKAANPAGIGLDIAQVDLESGDTLASYSRLDHYPSHPVEGFFFSLAPFPLAPGVHAVEVNTHFAPDQDRYALTSYFYRRGHNLLPAVSGLVTALHTTTHHTWRKLSAVATRHSGFADLEVREEIAPISAPDTPPWQKPEATARTYTLRFDGQRYRLPPAITRHP